LKAANLCLDEPVDVREESGRIVIEPTRRKEYDIAELVKGITRGNLHEESISVLPSVRRLGNAGPCVPEAGDIVWLSFNPRTGRETGWTPSRGGAESRCL
jgi:hypothetical protein